MMGDEMPSDMPDKPQEVSDSNFKTFIAKYPLVVVDCWAPWCGPCRMIAPVLEELAAEHTGKVVYGKLNTDENQQTAMEFGIMSIPTLLVFKDGGLVDRIIGAQPKAALEPQITQHL